MPFIIDENGICRKARFYRKKRKKKKKKYPKEHFDPRLEDSIRCQK